MIVGSHLVDHMVPHTISYISFPSLIPIISHTMMVQFWCSYSGHWNLIVASDNVLANCYLTAWFNLTLMSTISSSSIVIYIDRCCEFSHNSPNYITLKNWEHAFHHAIDTIKSPVNRKKTKLQSSATTLYCITQIRYPLHSSLWLFYRDVLPLFQKFKYASVSHPKKICKYSIAWYIFKS